MTAVTARNRNGIARDRVEREVDSMIRFRYSMASLILFLLILGMQSPVTGQPAAHDMASDPHYRLLLENDEVRVYAVTVPPHQEAYVAHERNFLTVTLQDSEVVIWRQGRSPVQHFSAPQGEVRFFEGPDARGIRNDTNSEYRNVTVEFKDPGVTTYGYKPETGKRGYGDTLLDRPVDPHGRFVNSLDLQHAVVNDVQLRANEHLDAHQPPRPELLIAVSAVNLASQRGEVQLDPGGIHWFESGRSDVVNRGAAPARFVMVGLTH